ncbi:MAG TPA: MFS transporter, partial [Roseomonas sp.]|nr:MFS transporter [Roseomonas sp.]
MTSSAPRFAILFVAQFGAVGVMMPFIPPLMIAAGLSAGQVGGVLAAGAAVRLLAGPVGGRLADALGRPKAVMAGGALVAALAACLYGLAQDLPGLLAANLLMAMGFAAVIPLGDAMALRAAREEGWDYGRVRALGSAAFIVTAGLGGWLVDRAG